MYSLEEEEEEDEEEESNRSTFTNNSCSFEVSLSEATAFLRPAWCTVYPGVYPGVRSTQVYVYPGVRSTQGSTQVYGLPRCTVYPGVRSTQVYVYPGVLSTQGSTQVYGLPRCTVYPGVYPGGQYQLPKGEVCPEELNKRQVLFQYWARWSKWYKYQPLDHIREYFGEKIAIYFAWLGFYTAWLLPAALVGTLVFLSGVLSLSDNLPAVVNLGLILLMGQVYSALAEQLTKWGE
ncbi:hypothetical protein CRUP_025271 [Coryphaenoides rupestris]|nr:hypothetical protein CRUP_025271 [Coryphaenoides rupestris]